MEEEKRRPGGQPGNRNALKHGYYSRIFNQEEEKDDYSSAAEVKGLDEEIALMRHVIKEAASVKDEKHMLIMVRASNALNKLIRTRFKVYGDQERMRANIDNVYYQTIKSMGWEKRLQKVLRMEDPIDEADLP